MQKKSNCFTCQTRSQSEWCDLKEDELTLLDKAKNDRSYGAAELVFTHGEENTGVYCIESGLIGLRKINSEGKSTLVRLHGPGQTIGYRSFLMRSEHEVTAEVLEPAHICFIPREVVQKLLEKNPSLGLHLLQQKTQDLSAADERFTYTVSQSTKIRLLHILLVLSERFGNRNNSNEHIIDVPLSRSDLAALIGVTPENLSRNIRQIQSEGIADFKGRKVILNNLHSIFDELELAS